MLCQNLLTGPVQLKTSDQWLSVSVDCVDCVHISLQKSKIVRFAFAEQPDSKKHAGLQNAKITDNCFPLYIQPIYCSLYNNKHMHAEDNKNVTHAINCAKNNVLLLVKLFLKNALYNTMSQTA